MSSIDRIDPLSDPNYADSLIDESLKKKQEVCVRIMFLHASSTFCCDIGKWLLIVFRRSIGAQTIHGQLREVFEH